MLKAKTNEIHNLNKLSSDLFKTAAEIDQKAQDEFQKIVQTLCKTYHVNSSTDTGFNLDCDGDFTIGLIGNLNTKQINEIQEITSTKLSKEIKKDPLTCYLFVFSFEDYWNEEYQ